MCDDLIHQGLVSDSGVSRRAFGVLRQQELFSFQIRQTLGCKMLK